jgi:hypothetical protein
MELAEVTQRLANIDVPIRVARLKPDVVDISVRQRIHQLSNKLQETHYDMDLSNSLYIELLLQEVWKLTQTKYSELQELRKHSEHSVSLSVDHSYMSDSGLVIEILPQLYADNGSYVDVYGINKIILVIRKSNTTLVIDQFYIDSISLYGYNAGKRIMDCITKFAKVYGISTMVVDEPTEFAKGFYAKCGFSQEHPDGKVMFKKLY